MGSSRLSMGLCSTASLCIFLSALHSVLAISETVKTSVKSGKTKFSCTLTLVSDGAAVVLGDSKAVCTPNKPAKKKVKDLKVSTDTGEYTLSFHINLELDLQNGLSPLGECHGECVCMAGSMEAITHKRKTTFVGAYPQMPSYCQ